MTQTHNEYQYTTIDFGHPDPRYRPKNSVSVYLQMDCGELVAGATINVGSTFDPSSSQK